MILTSTIKSFSVFAGCQILLATTLSVQAQPAFSAITNQTVFEDQPVGPVLLHLSDTYVTLDQIQLTATSSNPQIVPVTNIFFYAYFNDVPVNQGLLGVQRYISITPVFGQTGTSTVTIIANDGVGSATNSFVFTVNPPPLGSARFANTNLITIPTQGMAAPYPSQIVVSNMSGTITNLTVTLSQFNHAYPGDVDMLLVAPDNQTSVVIYSRAGDGSGWTGGATNITTTLSDNAIFALPFPYPLISIPFSPANYSSNTNGGPATFPSPAPLPSFYTNAPAAMSNFNGLSANGTWSLYVYGYTNYLNTNSGSIAAWSLIMATVSPPTINGLTSESTPVNTQTAAIPFNIYDAQTPAANLVLTATSSNPTLMTTSDIAFGGSDSNRTITLTPEPNQIGTTAIGVIVTDTDGMSATNSFLITVNPGQLTVTGITASDKIYDGTTNATVNASAAILAGQGLAGSDITLNSNGVSGAFADRNAGSNKIVQIAGLTLNGSDTGNYVLTQPATTANITKASATITVTPYNVTYDGSAHAAVGTANGVLNENLSGLDLSGTMHTAAGSYAGDGWTFTDVTGNYNNTNGTVSDAIGTVTLTVTANSRMRAYGATNPVFTVSYNGFVNSEGTNVLSGSPQLMTSAVTNSPVGGYVITNSLGNLVATNYAVSLVNGMLTVTGAVLTATANTGIEAQNKAYDGTTAATITLTNLILAGVVSGDAVSLSTNNYTANFACASVGTNIPVSVSGLTLSGASAANYTLASLAGLTANITPITLMVNAASNCKTFGMPNPALTASYSGFVNNEGTNVLTGAPSLSTSATINSPPGYYTISVGIGTLNATNYTFAFADGTLMVAAQPRLSGVRLGTNQLAITWPTITNQTYQLECATNLNQAVWTPLGDPVAGTGSSLIVTNCFDVSSPWFFRMAISP
jgi:hypothetical protein